MGQNIIQFKKEMEKTKYTHLTTDFFVNIMNM